MSLYTGSKDEKMLILLNWVKALNTDYQIASTDPKRYFIHSYKTFIRTTLKRLHRPFNKQVCGHAERFFPEIKAQIRECGGWDDDSVPFPL